MKKYNGDKRAVTALRGVGFAAALFLMVLCRLTLFRLPTLMLILMCAILLAWVGICIFWLPFYLLRLTLTISSRELGLGTGCIFQKRQIMQRRAVQYVTLFTTPFSYFTGLNFLFIRALGGGMIVPFLKLSDCKEIVKNLQSYDKY